MIRIRRAAIRRQAAITVLVGLAVSGCGGSSDQAGPASSFEAPLTIEPLIPVASALFLNSGPYSPGRKYGGSTVRSWVILDPDGGFAGNSSPDYSPAAGQPQLGPIGRWRISGQDLITDFGSGGFATYPPVWKTAAGLELTPRPRVDSRYYVANWSGYYAFPAPELGIAGFDRTPGLFVEALPPSVRECSSGVPVSYAQIWWQGTLDMKSDGNYRAGLQLMRRCGSAQTRVVSGHVLERLTSGTWQLSASAREITFIQSSGERLTARLDRPGTGLCVDGAPLVRGTGDPFDQTWVQPPTIMPIRSNLPLVLDDGNDCLSSYSQINGQPLVQTWVELNADGSAQAAGLIDLAARVARWRVESNELALSASDALPIAKLFRGWNRQRLEARVASAQELLGRWKGQTVTVFAMGTLWFVPPGTESPMDKQSTDSVEFMADGRYRFDAPASAEEMRPLSALHTGMWSLDVSKGAITFTPDGASPITLRISYETPGAPGSEYSPLGYQSPRLQIDGQQFIRP